MKIKISIIASIALLSINAMAFESDNPFKSESAKPFIGIEEGRFKSISKEPDEKTRVVVNNVNKTTPKKPITDNQSELMVQSEITTTTQELKYFDASVFKFKQNSIEKYEPNPPSAYDRCIGNSKDIVESYKIAQSSVELSYSNIKTKKIWEVSTTADKKQIIKNLRNLNRISYQNSNKTIKSIAFKLIERCGKLK